MPRRAAGMPTLQGSRFPEESRFLALSANAGRENRSVSGYIFPVEPSQPPSSWELGKIHASRAQWMIEMKRRPPSFKGLSGLTGLAAITFSLILSGCATSRPPGPTSQPESKAETKPEAKPETKPEAEPETKPETKPGARPELKPEPGSGG